MWSAQGQRGVRSASRTGSDGCDQQPARSLAQPTAGPPGVVLLWFLGAKTSYCSRYSPAIFPMDNDRKYRQLGYMDSGREARGSRAEHPQPQGPRAPTDRTGPRLPRLVQHVAAARCFNCATALPVETDFNGTCPRCHADLHCCKQCWYFEPSTRFQCLKPIPVRLAAKDKANQCNLFMPRVTVAREGTANTPPEAQPANARSDANHNSVDARNAFDRLFRKI